MNEILDIKQVLKKIGCDTSCVDMMQEIHVNQLSSLWYGGEVAQISFANHVGAYLSICADGQVYATLTKGKNEDVIFESSDKYGRGYFHGIEQYLPNDAAVEKATNGTYKGYHLRLDNNNWWSVVLILDGEVIDLDLICDDDDIPTCIASIVNDREDLYQMGMKHKGP